MMDNVTTNNFISEGKTWNVRPAMCGYQGRRRRITAAIRNRSRMRKASQRWRNGACMTVGAAGVRLWKTNDRKDSCIRRQRQGHRREGVDSHLIENGRRRARDSSRPMRKRCRRMEGVDRLRSIDCRLGAARTKISRTSGSNINSLKVAISNIYLMKGISTGYHSFRTRSSRRRKENRLGAAMTKASKASNSSRTSESNITALKVTNSDINLIKLILISYRVSWMRNRRRRMDGVGRPRRIDCRPGAARSKASKVSEVSKAQRPQ